MALRWRDPGATSGDMRLWNVRQWDMRCCLAAKAKRGQLRYLGNGALWSSVTEIADRPPQAGCRRAYSRIRPACSRPIIG